MKTLVLALLMMSSSAFAIGYKQMNSTFVVSSFANDGSRVYYNCDSVETTTKKMLERMGAKKIRVRCTGGISDWGRFSTEALVTARYQALSQDVQDDGNMTTALSTERFERRNNCHLTHQIFKAVAKNFEITNFSMGSCFRPGDRTSVTIDVIREI